MTKISIAAGYSTAGRLCSSAARPQLAAGADRLGSELSRRYAVGCERFGVFLERSGSFSMRPIGRCRLGIHYIFYTFDTY